MNLYGCWVLDADKRSPPLGKFNPLVESIAVVNRKGKVIILDWCRDYFVLKICDRFFKFIAPAYQHCYTQAELDRLLKAAGFNVFKNSKVRLGMIWELIAITAMIN